MTDFALEEDEEFVLVDSVENPEVVAAASALADARPQEDAPPPVPEEPRDGPVTLPAGFRRVNERGAFDVVRTAVVRELDGADEEKIARAKGYDDDNAVSYLNTILECGIEKLGDRAPTTEELNDLIVGDQQYLLTEIARATFGDDLHYVNFVCAECTEQFDVTLSLREDLPVNRLSSIDDVTFDVPLRNNRVAKVTLPTVEIARDALGGESQAEINTAFLASCVSEIRGGTKGTVEVSGDKEIVRRLGVVDRQTLINALGERMPGPQYNGIRFNHEPGCGKEIRLSIALADLFRGL